MTLSREGEAYIKLAEEEGGKPKLKAYNDGTGTWTIGWGCTKGVKRGMTITAAQAQMMLDVEIASHVDEVHRLITVPISQGLFDALVSFFFNNGAGKCPTLIKAVNSGSSAATRQAFMLYTKAYDERLGRKVTWPGLVNRRTAELAHWAKMDAKDAGPVPPPSVAEPSAKPEGSRKETTSKVGMSLSGVLFAFVAAVKAKIEGFIDDPFGALEAASTFVSQHGWEAAAVGALAGFLGFKIISALTRQDYAEGRYTPSGAAQ